MHIGECRRAGRAPFALIIAIAAGVLAAGCGGDGGGRSSNGNNSPPADTDDTLPSLRDDQVNDQDGTLEATIRYTTNGVPHITADNLEELGFGQGFAQARDNICIIADEILMARSERARFLGPGPDDINVITDFSYKALDILAKAQQEFDQLSPASQALLNGFAAGYNKYLADTGVDNLSDPRCSGQPWVRPIAPEEIYAYQRIVALFSSGKQFATGVTFLAAPPGQSPLPLPAIASGDSDVPEKTERMLASLDSSLQAHQPIAVRPDSTRLGSNGWGIGGDLTESGRGGLLANPHFSFTGNLRFWQSHNTVPGVIDVMGAALIGYPTPQIAFNEHLAWTHTVSYANRFTFYLLQLTNGDNLAYIKDGEEKPITSRTFEIEVADGSGGTITMEKTFYYSEYGPMIAADAINPAFPAWGDEFNGNAVAFSYRDANENTGLQFYDQWLGMGRAQNLAQFKSVFADCGTSFWVNTMYADDAGNAVYIDGGSVPNLSQESLAAFEQRLQASPVLATAFDQGLPILDGSTSRDDWIEDGCGYDIVPFEQRPQLTRSDFVQNSNDSYWITNPRQFLTGYSPLFGELAIDEDGDIRTRLALKMLLNPEDTGASDMAPAGTDGLFNARELVENALYSNRTWFSEEWGVLPALLQRCDAIGSDPVNLPDGDSRSVDGGCAAIEQWDGLVNLDSAGAHTFRVFMAHYDNHLPEDLSVPFDPADPINTPRNPKDPPEDRADDLMLQALAQGLEQLDAAGFAYDAVLAEVQAVQPSAGMRPGGSAIPAGAHVPWHGGLAAGAEGAFNVAASGEFGGNDTLYPIYTPEATFDSSGDLSTTPGEGYLVGSGAGWHFGLMFTDDGPEAYGLLSHSQSSNSTSPHFRDQQERYSNKDIRKLRFREAEITADSNLSTVTITSD